MKSDFEEKHKFVLEKEFDIGDCGYAYLISDYMYSETFTEEDATHYYFCIFFPNNGNKELSGMRTMVQSDMNSNKEFRPNGIMYKILLDYVKDCIKKARVDHGQDLFTDPEDAVFNVFVKLHQKKMLEKI